MNEIIGALREQQTELTDFLSGLSDEQWHHDSRCPGWQVRHVVLHLEQTNQMALGSATDTYMEVLGRLAEGLPPAADVDEGADAMVQRESHRSNDDIFEAWKSGAEALRDALAVRSPSDRVQWVVGTLSAQTLATTRLAETWIHTLDITVPFGVEPTFGDRLRFICRLAWRTLPYAFERSGRQLSGPVAFELTGPSGKPWSFVPDQAAVTTVRGTGLDLCQVAGRRLAATDTGLTAEGPDAAAVLELVRTFA